MGEEIHNPAAASALAAQPFRLDVEYQPFAVEPVDTHDVARHDRRALHPPDKFQQLRRGFDSPNRRDYRAVVLPEEHADTGKREIRLLANGVHGHVASVGYGLSPLGAYELLPGHAGGRSRCCQDSLRCC